MSNEETYQGYHNYDYSLWPYPYSRDKISWSPVINIFSLAQPNIDDVERFWDTRPCNILHSSQPFGTKEYFDEVEQRKYFVEPHIPKFAEFEMWRGKRVLEIGCGIGTDAVNFASAGAIYTTIELSKATLDIAVQRFQIYDLKGTFILGNAENIGEIFRGCTFDLIYSFGVIHHTPYPEKIIRSIPPLLSPGGEMRIMLYAKNSWKSYMIEAGYDQPEAQRGCPIARTWSVDEIRDMCASLNLEVISIEQAHIFKYQIEDYLKYRYIVVPWFAVMPSELFAILEKNLGWHLLIKAIKR
jgi:SAM-dependent methyltransferase